MVDHDISLQRVETSCGIRGNPLLWLKSYFSGRTQMVICGNTRTPWILVKYWLRRVQSWVISRLSFTCYIQPTFQPYSPNIPHLVTSMLMMCMVHLLISLLLFAALMLSHEICTSGCLPIGFRWIQTRRSLSGSALTNNFWSLISHYSEKDFPLLPFIPVFETLA